MFAAALFRGRAGGALFALRLQRHSVPFFSAQLARLYPDPSTDLARLTAAFGRLRFIHLSRGDKLAQAVSYVKAQQTGLWHRGADIAAKTGVSPATVSRVLRRAGLSRLRDLEPAEPVRRYEREHPGDMIHLDIKRLGKFERTGHRITGRRTGQSTQRSKRAGPGWEYVHVCVDDASRLAFSQVHPDEKAVSAVAHLHSAVAWSASMGITVARVMTDNGSCYKSHAFKAACAELGIRHIRTKPYTPQTNGKAERFIQTALREWAYARAYQTSDQRAADLPVWTHLYNWHRRHSALKSKPPICRLGLDRNNLLRFHN